MAHSIPHRDNNRIWCVWINFMTHAVLEEVARSVRFSCS